MNLAPHRLRRQASALLVIDFQERLFAAMEPHSRERTLKRTLAAIDGAKALGLPVFATEQYPKGLGPTVAAIRERIAPPIEKLRFSAAGAVEGKLGGRTQVLLVGMETHVCVFQTARDLVESGLEVYLCADAVLSRTLEDRSIGLELARSAGAVLTTVEAALFDLLGVAGTAEFKAVSAAVKG